VAETVEQVFEELQARTDPDRLRGQHASYRFDVTGVGSWRVDVDDGKLAVAQSDADADCVIETDEQTFMQIARREQNPAVAYMTGKVKVRGDTGLALRLRDFFE
jgi:putative sterol carrier protein